MREIREAYRATVVLLALLDTLWSNTNAMSKLLRNGMYGELAKKFSHQHSQAERLQADVRALEMQTTDEEDWGADDDQKHYAKILLRATRRMNREARVVARFHDIPTKDMYASELVRRMGR